MTNYSKFIATTAITLVACSLAYGDTTKTTGAAARHKKIPTLGVDPDAFVEGNLYFTAYHEMGHALISEFKIPVIGREEDAADRLATLVMTPEKKEEAPEYLTAAMNGWFITANDIPLSEIAWWDEHGTDKQRGFQIACLLYGADADRFKSIADKADLPPDRRETCIGESASNETSWKVLLDAHTFDEGEEPETKPTTVSYDNTKEYQAEQDYLKKLGLLADVADLMDTTYKFKAGIEVVASECGEPNAFWNSDDRKLTFCYELVREYLNIAETYK